MSACLYPLLLERFHPARFEWDGLAVLGNIFRFIDCPIYRLPKARSDVRPFLRSRDHAGDHAGLRVLVPAKPRVQSGVGISSPNSALLPCRAASPQELIGRGLPPGYTHHPWLLGLVQALYGQILPRNPTLSRGYLNREFQGKPSAPLLSDAVKAPIPLYRI